MIVREYNNFHNLDEPEFNRLNGRDRLTYLLERYHVGMCICSIADNYVKRGTVIGFYENTDIRMIVNGHAPPYNEMPKDPSVKIPQTLNVVVQVDGELRSYYPLWIYPDFVKIRNEKLELLGI